MTKETMSDHEVISALADGQLRGGEFVRAMNLLESSSEHRSTWHTFHVVGDVMRMGDCRSIERDSAFLQRLKSTLAQDAILSQTEPVVVAGVAVKRMKEWAGLVPAGNDAQFRWKAWGGVASVCAVSFVAWQMYAGSDDANRDAQVARLSAPHQVFTQSSEMSGSRDTPASDAQAVMIRDPRLDALLAAHQQLGGASALQNPTGFVRSATFTGAAR
jgi:sigma-E factor negative regulatory protein RseA